MDIDTLRELLHYEPGTGKFTWRARGPAYFASESRPLSDEQLQYAADKWNEINAGAPALTTAGPRGTRTGVVLGKTVQAHKVAFAMHWGHWPAGQIDHYNADKSDNRIENLRDVDRRMASVIRAMRAPAESGDASGDRGHTTWGLSPKSLWGLTWVYSEARDGNCQEDMVGDTELYALARHGTSMVAGADHADVTAEVSPTCRPRPTDTPPVNPLARGLRAGS